MEWLSLANAYQQLVALNIWVVQKSSKLFLMVQSLGSWAVLSGSLTGEVFVFLCPSEGCWCHCSFGSALLPSAGQVHCVTGDKELQMGLLLICCIGNMVTFCFHLLYAVIQFLCFFEIERDELGRMQMKIVHGKKFSMRSLLFHQMRRSLGTMVQAC